MRPGKWNHPAYRRIKPEGWKKRPPVFQNYIEQLLNRAGLQGFKRRGGEELSDLELLAELQHNGAATCLIDFTSKMLWLRFGSHVGKNPEKAGKVVAMATDESEDFSIVTYEDLKKPIKEFLNQGKLWKWTPSNLSNRIVAQGSFFVFGEGKIEERRYEEIRINAEQQAKNSRGIEREIRHLGGISFQ